MSTKVEIRAEPAPPAELLARASALAPALRERAAEAEELRRLPDASFDALMATGLYRIAVPVRFGGLDVDYSLALDVAEELARACPATGWCYGLWAAHAWLIGYWPLLAQEEVFIGDPDTLAASSLNTGKSTCVPVDGGYRLSGRWEFSSGCDFSDWVMLGVPGIGERNWALVPKADFQIVDTWFVSGLRGSGSKDIVVDDAFVPSHRVLDVTTAGDGDWTGWDLHEQTRYRAPIPALLGWDLVAPMIGIARGMTDEFIGRLSGTTGAGRTAESEAVHIRLSHACAEVDAARALMHRDVREILDRAAAGEGYSALDRARYRRDRAYAIQLCLQSANRIFDISGAHALFDSVALQRYHRDAHAVAHRDTLLMDFGGQDFGRLALGGST
ncbi:MAG: acyl-CoA dehydrogenase family protein [Chloroflexi bacterium]|nr:acyl-CoA dehydrogenase family protein [Chloroflexota bacterium]